MLGDVKFAANPKDPCLVHRLKSAKKFAHGACTVDDAMWAVSDEDERASVLQMYADKFGPNGFTVLTETAGVCVLQHIGMTFKFDTRGDLGEVGVSQLGWAENLLLDAGFTETFDTPLHGIYRPGVEIDPVLRAESPLLLEPGQLHYAHLIHRLMFGASRTYPEMAPYCSDLARVIGVARDYDMQCLLVSVRYLAMDKHHRLLLRPASLVPIASADAAYGTLIDAKSRSGVAVGFRGENDEPDSFLIFISQIQAVVAKSSTEAEIIAANLAADWMMWWAMLLRGFGIKRKRAVLERSDTSPYAKEEPPVAPTNPDGSERVMDELEILQDNLSAMHIVSHPYAGFKGTKHMRMRYFYIRELIMRGEVKLMWQRSEDMVADLLTKRVTLAVFRRLLTRLIGVQLPRVC
jgi:hypothetical protein